MIGAEQSAQIWYLDRSLQWHFLANSFKNYFRLLIAHLGLPQWPMLFTSYGLPPFLTVNTRFFKRIFLINDKFLMLKFDF